MKIALVIERLDPSRGGRETSAAQIAEKLVQAGQQVSIICQQGLWSAPGIEVVQLGVRGRSRVGRLKAFAHDVDVAGRQGGYDIIHAVLPIPSANVYQPRGGTVPAQRQAALRRRSPLARRLCELAEPLNFHRSAMAAMEAQVVGNPRALCLGVSAMVAREFQQHYGRSDGVRAIFNGVDVPRIDPHQRQAQRRQVRAEVGAGESDVVFLTIATNYELKGVRQTMEAFARWVSAGPGRRGARLVVVGRQQAQAYQRLAKAQGLAEQVVFVGPTREVFAYYSAADVFVLLSWYDACSRSVLEATRWGVPSITTAYNGAAEALAGGAGVVVGSPDDVPGVVAAMDELWAPESREQRRAACLHVADSLGVDRHVSQLLTAYEQVAGRS